MGKSDSLQQLSGDKGSTLPEYLEMAEVEALIASAPHAQARLLILIQWRAGLRISEAVAVEAAELTLEDDRPTLRVRRGKGRKTRMVPVHPELAAGLQNALAFADVGQGPIIGVSRSTGWRWIKAAAAKAMEMGLIHEGREIGTHTLRHSYARHLLMSGIPIN